MAIDLTKISSMDTKISTKELLKCSTFITTADKATLPKIVKVDEKEPIELKPDEVDEKEDLKVDKAIDDMIARWFRTSGSAKLNEADLIELKTIAKKMYYERLKTGDSRIVWRVLKEYITGVKSEMI